MKQELTHPSLQTSKAAEEGGEPRNVLPLVDEATVPPSQPSELHDSSQPKRKGLRSTAAKKKVERVETKIARPSARSGLISTATKGRKAKQPKRRNKNESASQDAPSVSPCSPPRESTQCDKPPVSSAGSQLSKSHHRLSSLHPGRVTIIRSEVRNPDSIEIPGLNKPDRQKYRRCSSEPPGPLRVAYVLEGCRASSTSVPAESQSGDVRNRPETRPWARQFPAQTVEASSPTTSRLRVVPSCTQHSDLVLSNQTSTKSPHQTMTNSEGLMPLTTAVESDEVHRRLDGITSCYPKSTGRDSLLVGKGLLRHKEVETPGHSTCEASDCIPTSDDYNTMKRNLVASENTYKRLSAAYQEFHRSNTIAHQRASIAESELKRLKKEMNRLQKENTEYKANHNRVKRQAKQKTDQAVVVAQQKSPTALGPQGELDNVQIDLPRPEVSTTESPSQISHCERPVQSPFVGAPISLPLSVVNTKEPCMPGMEGADACSGQIDWSEFGELGKGLDNLDWGDMDPMEFEMACNSIFEDVA